MNKSIMRAIRKSLFFMHFTCCVICRVLIYILLYCLNISLINKQIKELNEHYVPGLLVLTCNFVTLFYRNFFCSEATL